MPNLTLYPSTFSVSRAQQVTVTSSGTSWSDGTTFASSDGSASISGVTINNATSATFTLQPGPHTGPQTITASSGATGIVTVATSVTRSGSHLVCSGGFVYDGTNEFSTDAVGHTLVISGGSGWAPGHYAISSVTLGYAIDGGTHNVLDLRPISDGANAPASGATGGTWTYLVGSGAAGYSGGNLTPWDGDAGWYFDPDAPVISALNGTTITLSGGSGFTAGSYTVDNFLGSYPTHYGNVPMIHLAGNHPAAAGSFGGAWAKSGGATILTPTVNSAFTGAIKLGLGGDSITLGQSTTPGALAAQYPNASRSNVVNGGVSGSTSTSWLPGNASGNLASFIATCSATGASVVSLMLGTNDARAGLAATAHKANMQSIVNAIRAGVPTVQAVVLQEQPALADGDNAAAENTLLRAYFASYSTVASAVPGVSNSDTHYAVFLANPQLLADGIHPAPGAGKNEVDYTWLTSLATSIVAAGSLATPVNISHATFGSMRRFRLHARGLTKG